MPDPEEGRRKVERMIEEIEAMTDNYVESAHDSSVPDQWVTGWVIVAKLAVPSEWMTRPTPVMTYFGPFHDPVIALKEIGEMEEMTDNYSFSVRPIICMGRSRSVRGEGVWWDEDAPPPSTLTFRQRWGARLERLRDVW